MDREISVRVWRKDINVSIIKYDVALSSFEPFKYPWKDGIYPAYLQQGIEILLPSLVTPTAFRAL